MTDVSPESFANVKPVPSASAYGAQEGIVPPGKRKYKPGMHKLVSNAEAVANMVARMKGEMPKIDSGVDIPQLKPKPKDDFALTDDDNVLDPGPNMANPYPTKKAETQYSFDDLERLLNKLLEKKEEPISQTPETPVANVMMELRQEQPEGVYASIMTVGLPVTKVLSNSVSITLISPLSNNQYTFQPAPGSDIILNGSTLDNVHVFYPGTSFVLPEYGISGMSFVRAN